MAYDEERVRGYWSRAFGVDEAALRTPGVTVLQRPTVGDGVFSVPAVAAVRLGDAVVVVCPEAVADLLPRQPDAWSTVAGLRTLLELLATREPRPVGVATLSYAGAAPEVETRGVRSPTAEALERLYEQCAPDEVAESGIVSIDERLARYDSEGHVQAVSGFEVWDATVGHVCVLAAPAARGTGVAREVADAATTAALERGLVPQARCRIGNAASASLALRLGYEVAGAQLTLVLDSG